MSTEALCNNNEMYAEDYAAMQSALKPMLSTPTAQAKSWSGINGDGDIRVSLAISSSQGMPCQSISDCESPCRNYTYTYVGERKDGWVINEERTGRLCYLGPRGWNLQSSETVKKSRMLNKSQRLIDEETAKAVAKEKEKIRKEQEAKDEQDRINRERAVRDKREREIAEREKKILDQKEKRFVLVKSIQTDLNTLRYEVGVPDGAFGEQTMNGVQLFISDSNLSNVVFSNIPSNDELETVRSALKTVISNQENLQGCESPQKNYLVCTKVNQ